MKKFNEKLKAGNNRVSKVFGAETGRLVASFVNAEEASQFIENYNYSLVIASKEIPCFEGTREALDDIHL